LDSGAHSRPCLGVFASFCCWVQYSQRDIQVWKLSWSPGSGWFGVHSRDRGKRMGRVGQEAPALAPKQPNLIKYKGGWKKSPWDE